MRPRDPDATTNFYQTELGKTLRIDETDEGRDQRRHPEGRRVVRGAARDDRAPVVAGQSHADRDRDPRAARVAHRPPNGDMFMNYMDYVDDAAMVMFATGADHPDERRPRRTAFEDRALATRTWKGRLAR